MAGELLRVDGLERRPDERAHAREHLVDDARQRVDVAAPVDVGVAVGLLGAHVQRSTAHDAGVRLRVVDGGLEGARDAKVGEHRLPRAVEQDVLRLHVAVDQTARVRVRQRVRERARDRHDRVERELRLALHPVSQRSARHVRQHEVQLAVVLSRVEHGDDVRVAQLVGVADLPQKAVAGYRLNELGAQNLDRDRFVPLRIAGQVDDRHAAAPEFAPDGVAAGNDSLEGTWGSVHGERRVAPRTAGVT